MEVALLAVGRLKAGPEAELFARYLHRAQKAGRGLGLRGFAVTELAESRATRPADRIAAEAAALLGGLDRHGRTVCLDVEGELLDSEAFAARLGADTAAAVPRTTFVIGGPDGLAGSGGAKHSTAMCFS